MGQITGYIQTGGWCLAIVVFLALQAACGTAHRVQQEGAGLFAKDSTVTDPDGNQYPVRKMLDGNLWMTANLRTGLPGSWCYDDAKANCDRYGRLYTWEMAHRGCALLGEGWRLPTYEEWRQLSFLYGQFAGDTVAARKRAFPALLSGGAAGFNAVLGGGRTQTGAYARGDAHGFYWTATASDSALAYFANFAKGSQALYIQPDGEKERGFSVRCIRRK